MNIKWESHYNITCRSVILFKCHCFI